MEDNTAFCATDIQEVVDVQDKINSLLKSLSNLATQLDSLQEIATKANSNLLDCKTQYKAIETELIQAVEQAGLTKLKRQAGEHLFTVKYTHGSELVIDEGAEIPKGYFRVKEEINKELIREVLKTQTLPFARIEKNIKTKINVENIS